MRLRSRAVVVTAVGVSIAGLGIAYAAWTVQGTGEGFAQAGTAQELTVDGYTTGDNLLYPGGSGDVNFTVNNPNPFPIRVDGVFQQDATSITSDSAACDSAGNDVSFNPTDALDGYVDANSSADFVLADGASMGFNSNDACQDAIFTIPLAVNGIAAPDPSNAP